MANKDIRELYANTSVSIIGESSDLIMTPAGSKALVDSYKADNTTVVTGTDDQKYVTPKGLKDNYVIKTGGSFTGAISIGSPDAPGAELEVFALGGDEDVRIQLRASPTAIAQFGRASTLTFIDASDGPFAVYTSGTARFSISSTGTTTFSSRPSFNGNLAWDAGNFNPSDYIPKVGGVFTGPVTVTNLIANNSVIIRGGGVGSEGGQITIGWGNDLATGITGQQNNTWNIDVGNGDAYSQLRVFSVKGDGTSFAVMTANGNTNALSFGIRPTFNGNLAWDAGNFDPTTKANLSGATFTGAVKLENIYPNISFVDTTQAANTKGFGIINTGGYLHIATVADDGLTWDSSPITINRSTKQTAFGQRPVFGINTPWDSGNLPNPVTEAPLDGSTYARKNGAWAKSVGGAIMSDTAPGTPESGQKWIRTTDMKEFVWYTDGDSGQWVEDMYSDSQRPANDDNNYVMRNGVWVKAPVQLIQSQTAATGAWVEVTTLPSEYASFTFRARRIVVAATAFFLLQFRQSGTWRTASYSWAHIFTSGSTVSAWNQGSPSASANYLYISGSNLTAGMNQTSCDLTIDPGQADQYPGVSGIFINGSFNNTIGGAHQNHGRIDGIRFGLSTGNITLDYEIYGNRK